MDIFSVPHYLDVLDADLKVELLHGLVGVVEQAFLERGILPGPGDDTCAVERPDVLLVGSNGLVDGIGRKQPFLDEKGLQGAGARPRVVW